MKKVIYENNHNGIHCKLCTYIGCMFYSHIIKCAFFIEFKKWSIIEPDMKTSTQVLH